MAAGFVYRFDNGLFLGQFQPQVPITRAVIRSKKDLRIIEHAWRQAHKYADPIRRPASRNLATMPGKIVPVEIKVLEE